MSSTLEFGVPGGMEPGVLADVAAAVEGLGYAGLWVNDTATGDGLADLRRLARSTTIQLGVGVLPLDRWAIDRVVDAAADLPADRVTIGIGAGQARRAPELLATSILELRTRLPAARLIVGTLNPGGRRVAAASADGILLNWTSPALAKQIRSEIIRERRIEVAAYVRAAAGPGSDQLLRDERLRYGLVRAYRRQFATQPDDVGPHGWIDPSTAVRDVASYRAAVDRLVFRAVPANHETASWVAVAERCMSIARGGSGEQGSR